MGKKRIKAYDRTAENDIRYRGPLTYRHLLVFGWICISFKILYILTTLGISIDANQPDWVYTLSRVSSALGDLALPLFLFANFAIILDKKQTYGDEGAWVSASKRCTDTFLYIAKREALRLAKLAKI